jgi:DNA recombination protein RmuC
MGATVAIGLVLVVGLGLATRLLLRFLRVQLAALRIETATQLGERSGEIDRRLEGMTLAMDRRLSELDHRVDRRLEHATHTATQIHQQLGKLGEANTQMLERAKELSRLEQALRPPKARGGFGELLLANLLADTFPADRYDLQYTFRSGERVDAVIRIDRALVPVDAKFPLENFERLVEADGEPERELHGKQFARDVKTHVDAIAEKYIRPEEGTYEFALMYLPAEAVYYELVCGRGPGGPSPLAYALERKVIPVSPSTLHAYLLVIVLGFKGLQIEEHAREVMAYCAQLGRDFSRFKEDFELVGTHLGRAQTKFTDAEKRLGRFEAKLERAAESEALPEPPSGSGEPPELARALDAA